MIKKYDSTVSENESKDQSSNSFAITLFSTFTTVFIAELGDKTQVATLLLSAESGSPLIVFIGASLALVLSSLFGVLLGRYISKHIPPSLFSYLAGSLMTLIGLWLLVESLDSKFNIINFQ